MWIVIFGPKCFRFEFKTNHEEWICSVKPTFGPAIAERVKAAIDTSSDLVDEAMKVRQEARTVVNELLMVCATNPNHDQVFY